MDVPAATAAPWSRRTAVCVRVSHKRLTQRAETAEEAGIDTQRTRRQRAVRPSCPLPGVSSPLAGYTSIAAPHRPFIIGATA